MIDEQVVRTNVVVDEAPGSVLERLGNRTSEVGFGPNAEVGVKYGANGVGYSEELGADCAPRFVLSPDRCRGDAMGIDPMDTAEQMADVLRQPSGIS